MSDIDAQMHRDIGALTATVQAQGARIDGMEKKIGEMHDVIMRANGGWRVLVIVGSAGIALGGLLFKLIPGWIR